MVGTVGPDVALAAVALQKSHPSAPAIEVLDVVMRLRVGRLSDFGDSIKPATPFGFLLAEAFDTGMASQDWNLVTHPNTPPQTVAALTQAWEAEVLAKFAAHFRLTP